MNDTEALKQQKSALIGKYAKRHNGTAFMQTLTTLVPFFGLFYLALVSIDISLWLTVGIGALLILFILRIFMMMHDAGHGCLYETPLPNKIVGFIMGVLCGIPEMVWSKHHAYHHSTNGNWNKYRGPLNVLSVDEYSALSDSKKKSYENSRNIMLAPLGGFMYFIFNPRFTWAKGSVQFVMYVLKNKLQKDAPSLAALSASFETRYWANWSEYRHMAGNNLVLLPSLALACAFFGWAPFLSVYVLVLSLGGALGIILFTIQHNFEDSYASGDEGWNYYSAALEGTSYLDLPKWLHWFTADIGYHHIHHLSARIPNYKLVACHEEYKHLFDSVTRIKLSQVGAAFKHILWDNHTGRMITVAQFDELASQPAVG